MKKITKLFPICLLLSSMTLAPMAFAAENSVPVRSVAVEGEGTVFMKSDMATIRMAVETRDPSASRAVRDNAVLTTKVREALIAKGFSPESITTINYRVYRQTRSSKSSFSSGGIEEFVVDNSIRLVLRDLSRVGEAIDVAVGAGVNNVYSISFLAENIEESQKQARNAAIENAREIAGQMATTAGAKLGKVLRIADGNSAVPAEAFYDNMNLKMARGVSTPISADDQKITVRVSCIFELE
ncbi:MAG: SIMPL domain-containing protein [Opitutales bacterium]|nr:SIMPL domain-containing protein [Opitutales bacterium]